MDGRRFDADHETLRRFWIEADQIKGDRAWLTGDEVHHARKVLRLGRGDHLRLLDGLGFEYLARIAVTAPDHLELEILDKQPASGESALNLVLGLAMLKSDHMDLVVRKGTELGLTTLAPVYSARTTARLKDDRNERRLERWRKISLQAVKQCRRARPVEVRRPVDLEDFLADSDRADLRILLHERLPRTDARTRPEWIDQHPPPRSIRLLVGPEGGWTDGEAARAMASGFAPWRLGPRILRAETAAVALMAIVGYQWGDLK